MSAVDPQQHQLRQLEFERNYAEAQCGRLFVQNQHLQEAVERLTALLQQHRIDPSTGEQSLRMEEANGEVTEVIERGSVRQSP